MSRVTDFLSNIRRIMRLHESMLKSICGEYHLTLIEATIISFLYNNPELDRAADIVELRMLSKGNVSQAVESLIQKSLLSREQDKGDRRKIHLYLTPACEPITKSIEKIGKQFHEEVFSGLSAEERLLFEKVNQKIVENTKKAMVRGEMD